MRDDAHTTHTEQGCASMLGIVEILQCGRQAMRLDTGPLENTEHHRRDCLVELEHDVADETVADDNVDCPAIALSSGQVTALDVTNEVESSATKQLVRLLHDCIPLLRLFPNAQQANCWVVATENVLGVNGTKASELHQLV